jgi:putative transposase
VFNQTQEHSMTNTIIPRTDDADNSTLLGDASDSLRELFERTLREAMELELGQHVGAGRYERSGERLDHRNGIRHRRFDTRLGSLDLEVPRLRDGNYMPSFLEHRTRSERALIALVQEAVIGGVSTRKIAKIVAELGITSLSKSQVSEFCTELDELARAFRERPLSGNYPYLFLDAVFEKMRIGRTIVSQACVIAYGVREDGVRELIGLDIVDTESEASWATFLRGLCDRGLTGVKLAITDAHGGLIKAVQTVLVGASWQRCKVHFTRNVTAHAPEAYKKKLAGDLQGIFSQPTAEAALVAYESLRAKYLHACGKAMQILEDGLSDTLTFMAFPREHWSRVSSTNPIERINREIRRRTRVVGIFPSVASALRLIGMLLLEQTEDWHAGKRYMSEASMDELYARAASA